MKIAFDETGESGNTPARRERSNTLRKYARVRGLLAVGLTLMLTGCTGPAGPVGSTGRSTGNAAPENGTSVVNDVPVKSGVFHMNDALTSKWMQVDSNSHAVTIVVTIPVDNLSLNGFNNGFADITVPQGWRVSIQFHNQNPVVAGSIAIVNAKDMTKGSEVQPALAGGAMPNYQSGIPAGESSSFSFVTSTQGTYVIESPLSWASGTWLWFDVTNTNGSRPSVATRS